MRLVLDLNRCQGYAQCVFLAADVFELRGNEALHYDGHLPRRLPGADSEGVWKALALHKIFQQVLDDPPPQKRCSTGAEAAARPGSRLSRHVRSPAPVT